jgi:hypothetical protein
MSYASETTVPVFRSQQEIQEIIGRYGASSFMFGMKGSQAMIGFEAGGRQIKMVINMPGRDVFRRDKRGNARTDKQMDTCMAQGERQRWRALVLIVKAKLEAVASGVATFEQEFLPYMVLPGGKTVHEELAPRLAAWYQKGEVPKLLLTSGGATEQ